MQSFKIDSSTCFCCEADHKGLGEKKLICDREIVSECIRLWFGSCEDFEALVQSSISNALASQLGRQAFPFHWLVGCTSPILWGEMDLFASDYLANQNPRRIFSTIHIVGWWLGGFPILLWWAMFLSRRCCQPVSSRCLDALQTLAVALLVCPAYFALYAYQIILQQAWPSPIPGAAIFAGTASFAAPLLWYLQPF